MINIIYILIKLILIDKLIKTFSNIKILNFIKKIYIIYKYYYYYII